MAGAANPATTAQPQNVFGQAAQAYQGALGGTAAAGMGMPQTQAFMNPYTQQVINSSMGDLERQRKMQTNQIGAQASAAGAYGGSRHGVAEALTNEAFARQGGQMAAQLRQQGYGQALGAAQQQQQLGLQAAGQLGNLAQMGYGFGTGITQQQQQYGQQQQALNQALIDAARGQYAGFTGAPAASLQLPMAAVGAGNMGQGTTTKTSQPGLFDYLTLGALWPRG